MITCRICGVNVDERAIDFWVGLAICKNCGHTHENHEFGETFGFDVWSTGGGCEAMVRRFGRSIELWATDEDGMSVPDLNDKARIHIHWMEPNDYEYAPMHESDESAATLSDAADMLARWWMDRWKFDIMSLDEWLAEHAEVLSQDDRQIGGMILKFCEEVSL